MRPVCLVRWRGRDGSPFGEGSPIGAGPVLSMKGPVITMLPGPFHHGSPVGFTEFGRPSDERVHVSRGIGLAPAPVLGQHQLASEPFL